MNERVTEEIIVNLLIKHTEREGIKWEYIDEGKFECFYNRMRYVIQELKIADEFVYRIHILKRANPTCMEFLKDFLLWCCFQGLPKIKYNELFLTLTTPHIKQLVKKIVDVGYIPMKTSRDVKLEVIYDRLT